MSNPQKATPLYGQALATAILYPFDRCPFCKPGEFEFATTRTELVVICTQCGIERTADADQHDRYDAEMAIRIACQPAPSVTFEFDDAVCPF